MRRAFLFLLLIVIPFAFAETNSISVLSVSQNNQSLGGVAEVHLEIRPGRGSVYINSFPLTKLDTQISTRFAKEYARKLAGEDCSNLDFFYVIESGSTIIGGPSAGAAITVLTYSSLQNVELDENIIMTGTISSGGLVGPVGRVPEKILAAEIEGFREVLVPILEYNKSLESRIKVVPVNDVEEAIFHFTGHNIQATPRAINVPNEYFANMEGVADSLCTRARLLNSSVDNLSNSSKQFLSLAHENLGLSKFYSAASYCFTANLELRERDIMSKSQGDLRRMFRQLESDISDLDESLPDDLNTIADLEVFMIVRERLIDAQDTLDQENYDNITPGGLGYALERFNSALTWSSFFGKIPSQPLDVSEDQLRKSCISKLAEAEERINFISYLTTFDLRDTRLELRNAYEDLRQEEFALCLFKASKAKAEANSVINAYYAGGQLNSSVKSKISKAGEVIALQTQNNMFPILSYSYFEYADSLENQFSANLYAEYAIELAALDIYFPAKTSKKIYDYTKISLAIFGVIIGFIIGVLTTELAHKHRKKKIKARKKK